MGSTKPIWSSLAEFLQSEKLSEYIPTFSTLNLKAFSELTAADIDAQVSPFYDRQRIIDAVNFARACLESGEPEDPLRKLTPTNYNESIKTPKKSSKKSHPKVLSSTPNKKYLTAAGLSKASLRPTKSLSPPMPKRVVGSGPKKLSLSAYERTLATCESGDQEEAETRGSTGNDEEASNLVRLRRTLGSSDPSLSSADKTGENSENASYHRGRSGRRGTEFRLSSGEFSPNHSPCPSPRTLSPNRPAVLPNLVNLNIYNHRRWSVASSASDYYSGSPSSLSSASSQERLYYPGYRVSDEDVSHVQLQRQHSQDSKTRPRPRARSLSPERQPDCSITGESSFNIYKERFPQAKDEMENQLENFILLQRDRNESLLKGEANSNFIHHRVTELAKDILDRSREERITDTYFEEVSTTLMRLISDSERTSANMLPGTLSGDLVTKEASELLKVISRSARLLECLTFSVGSFYSQVQEGTIDELLRSTASLPRYISSRLSTKFGGIDNDDPISPCSLGPVLPGAPSGPSSVPAGPRPSSSGSGDEMDRSTSQFKEEDFEVRKLISNGAYGEVFLVKHVESRELFALKRIRKDRVIERSEVERAFMERDILSFVQNPFVVSMLCSFQTKTHLCMVLEYVECGDVGTLLRNVGCLELGIARIYHAEALLALEYIHSYGIVHRDLKPENLLITKEGHIKLTDFGLSKCGLIQLATRGYESAMGAFDDEGGCIGTPDYIAPEVFYSRQYGFSVDWWSMGIILYQFLVGVPPFSGDTIRTLVESIDPRNIEWPDDEPLDREAQNLILGLLYMDPSQRLGAQGAQEVKKQPFYSEVHWDELMMRKAEFIPYLESDEDTSYFDTRSDRYDHSITEDCLPSLEDNACHIKYFDSVNWSSAEQFIALNSPRNRHLSHDSHDSVDSGTDNQPSISTDEGSSGEQPGTFHTSTPVKVNPASLTGPAKNSTPPEQPMFDSSGTCEDSSSGKGDISGEGGSGDDGDLPTPSAPTTPTSSDMEKEALTDVMRVAPAPASLPGPNKSPVKKLDLSALHNNSLSELDEDLDEPRSGERTITLIKGVKGFGFTLTAIKVMSPSRDGKTKCVVRHLVSDVAKFGAAAEAGLKKDDLINAVNGIPANPLTHCQLVDVIRTSERQVELVVQHLSHTSIQTRRSNNRKGKKKKRQSSFFKKATNARGVNDSLSMEKFLHLSRSKTREKQNSDSDKSGGEQDALMVHGHQVFTEHGTEAENVLKSKPFRSKFSRRRPSSTFVAPVSPLARTPSPTNCYFNNDGSERKTPRSSNPQKTLHITHPRTQSLSSVSKSRPTPAEGSPVASHRTLSPCLGRRQAPNTAPANVQDPLRTASSDQSGPSNSAASISTAPSSTSTARGDEERRLSAIRGDHLQPVTRERKKSWVQAYEDRDVL